MPPAFFSALAGSVTAKTMHHSAVGALVVHSLQPVIFQPSPERTVNALIMEASELAPGSRQAEAMDVAGHHVGEAAAARFSVTCVRTGLGPEGPNAR